MKTISLSAAVCAAFLLGSVSLSAEAYSGSISSIADDSALRASLSASLLEAPPAAAQRFKPQRRELPDGSSVEVRVERGRGEFIIVIARKGEGGYDLANPGGWALYRRLSDGEPTRVRIFPSADPNCYVQLRPDRGGRTLLDCIVYGGYLGRSAVLPLTFERAILEPLSSIVSLAGASFPRRYFEPRSADYDDERAFIAAVRGRIGELTYEDDGAIDRDGRPVFIDTLEPRSDGVLGVNCSGFAKWLIDGLLRPLGFDRLSVAVLKKPPVARGNSFSEPYEEVRDPYFGLDWTRNLAAAAGRAFFGSRGSDPAEYEVVASSIAALRVSGGDGSSSISYPKYMKDSGFSFPGLKATLYALAIDEPGKFYLASVNRDIGDEPRLRQHFHVAALFPLFDERGRFSVVVFESAAETDFGSFAARYQDHLVHLVRIPVERSFDP